LDDAIAKIDDSLKFLSSKVTLENTQLEMDDLNKVNEKLNEELSRFRNTRATRKYNFEFVERFFVFFYSLKAILEQLDHVNQQLDLINTEVQADS